MGLITLSETEPVFGTVFRLYFLYILRSTNPIQILSPKRDAKLLDFGVDRRRMPQGRTRKHLLITSCYVGHGTQNEMAKLYRTAA